MPNRHRVDGPSWRTGEWPGPTTPYGERRPGIRCESGAVPPLSPGSRPRRRPRAHARKAGARDDPGARTLPRTPRTRQPDEDREEGTPWASCCCPRRTPTCSPRARRARTTGSPTRPAPPPESSPPSWRGPTSSWCGSSAAPAPGPTGWRRCARPALPVVALGGEQAPDAEMMEQSTVPAGVAAEAHTYLAQGGPANLGQLHAFLSDTLLFTGQGFDPPVELPSWGIFERAARDVDNVDNTDGPVVAVLYYRAQQLAGNTAYVEALCTALEDAGAAPAAGLLRLAAPGRARAPAHARRRGRHGRHRARRRAARSPPRPRRAARTRPGTSPSSPRSTCRSCRASASPPAAPRWAEQRRGAVAARRRHPGRRARVRRAAHHGSVLVQGVRRRRPHRLRPRPRTRRPRRRDRRAARPAAAHPATRASGSC